VSPHRPGHDALRLPLVRAIRSHSGDLIAAAVHAARSIRKMLPENASIIPAMRVCKRKRSAPAPWIPPNRNRPAQP